MMIPTLITVFPISSLCIPGTKNPRKRSFGAWTILITEDMLHKSPPPQAPHSKSLSRRGAWSVQHSDFWHKTLAHLHQPQAVAPNAEPNRPPASDKQELLQNGASVQNEGEVLFHHDEGKETQLP